MELRHSRNENMDYWDRLGEKMAAFNGVINWNGSLWENSFFKLQVESKKGVKNARLPRDIRLYANGP